MARQREYRVSLTRGERKAIKRLQKKAVPPTDEPVMPLFLKQMKKSMVRFVHIKK